MSLDLCCEIILRMEREGFRIHVVICDLGNQGFLSQVGFHEGKHFFQHPGDPDRIVFVMPDVPHVLKLARNHLFDHGFLVPTEDKTHLVHLDKQDFEDVLEKDSGQYKATKLTEFHLNVKGSERQRVSHAVHVFSDSVANVMKFGYGSDTPEAKAKSNAVQTFSDWFKVMNSKMKFDTDQLSCALGMHFVKQFDALKRMEEFMDIMEIDHGQDNLLDINGKLVDDNFPDFDYIEALAELRKDDDHEIHIADYKAKDLPRVKVKRLIEIRPHRKRPTPVRWQRGIYCIIKSIKGLYHVLVEKGPMDCIITRRTNQDCLENFFSQERGVGGCNAHPDPLEYQRRFTIILIGKHADIMVDNPAVQMETKDENITKEEQEIASSMQEIVTKSVTKNIPVAYVHELNADDDIPDFENYDDDGIVVTTFDIPEIDLDVQREYRETWSLGSQMEVYVAGYFAKKNKEYKLGTKTSEIAEIDPDRLKKFPWLRMISKGGLYAPNDEWLEDFRKFEQEFIDYHKDGIRKEDWVINNFAKVLESKFCNKYPKALYMKFAKFRTTMRIKSLNKKGITGEVMIIRDGKQKGQFQA